MQYVDRLPDYFKLSVAGFQQGVEIEIDSEDKLAVHRIISQTEANRRLNEGRTTIVMTYHRSNIGSKPKNVGGVVFRDPHGP